MMILNSFIAAIDYNFGVQMTDVLPPSRLADK